MATYLLYGLDSSTTSVSSSKGWADQPTLDFPSTISERPSIQTDGVRFTNGEYLNFSSHFDNMGADYFTVNIWVKKNDHELGKFLQVANNFTNTGYAQGLGAFGLESFDGGEEVRPRVNNAPVPDADEDFNNNKWIQIGFGWGKDEGYFKLKSDDKEDEEKEDHPVSSWSSITGGYYIGCTDSNCGTSTVFTIHSIAIFSDSRPGLQEDLYGAPYNEWYPEQCGSGTRDTDEECDDGNYNDGDGCSKQCIVEDGWQ